MTVVSEETLKALLSEIVNDIKAKVNSTDIDSLITEYLKENSNEVDLTEAVVSIINNNIETIDIGAAIDANMYTFKTGTVTTLNSGSSATVNLKTDAENKIITIDFGIPKGADGNGSSGTSSGLSESFIAALTDTFKDIALWNDDQAASHIANIVEAAQTSSMNGLSDEFITALVDTFKDVALWKNSNAAAHINAILSSIGK